MNGYRTSAGRREETQNTRVAYAFFAVYIICLWLPAPLDISGTGITAGYLPLGLAFLLLLFSRRAPLRLAQLPPQEDRLFKTLIALLTFLTIWCLFSAFQASEIIRIGRPMATYAQAILTLIMLRALLPSLTAQVKFVELMLWTAIVMSGITVLASFVGPLRSLMPHYGDRIPGFFKHPNQTGIVSAMFLPILVARITARSYRSPRLIMGAALVLLALVVSGSKTNLLIAAATSFIAIGVTSILHRDPLLRAGALTMNMSIGVVVVVLAGGWLATFNPRAFDVLGQLVSGDVEFGGSGAYHSLNSRNNLWDYSIMAGFENPLFGEGAGQPFKPPVASAPHSHNAILDAFRTLGFPGAIATTAMLLMLLVYCSVFILNLIRFSYQPIEWRATFVGISLGSISYIIANQMSDSLGPSTSPFLWLFISQLLVSARYFLHRN